jgi:hypothetical protein
MSPSIANQRFRKRHLLVVGMVALVGLVLTPAFQKWACRLALNEATAHRGMEWSVGSASVGLFPIGVELDDVTLTQANGTHLRFGHVAADFAGSTPRVERLIIDAVDGVVIPSLDSTPAASSIKPISLELDTAAIRNVNIEVRSAQAAVLVEWEHLKLTALQWDGSRINGALYMPNASATPLPLNGATWSGAWSAPMSIAELDVRMESDDSLQVVTVKSTSDWGHLAVNWQESAGEHTVAFEATPTYEHWPVHPEHWLNDVPRVASDSTISGQFAWNAETIGTGSVSQMDVDVPLGFQGANLEIGPINIETARLAFLSEFAGMPLPSYFGVHRRWVLAADYNGTQVSARLTPDAISDQSLELTWDVGKDSSGFTAALNGFSIDPNELDLRTGDWRLVGDGAINESGWGGQLTASHPAGDVITTAWTVATESPTLSFSTDTRLARLVPAADEATPWELFARIGWRGSGSGMDNWTQVLEIRDIVLLENRVPRTFERFDAVQKRNGDAWSLEWASSLASGKATCNTALLTDWSFNPTRLAFESKTESPSALPQLDIHVNVANLEPIALLADWPLTTPEPFTAQASWNGTSGSVQTRITALSGGSIQFDDVAINGTLSTRNPSHLNWEGHGLSINSSEVIAFVAGQLEAGTSGLDLMIQSCTGQLGDDAFALAEPARVSIDAETATCRLSSLNLQSKHGSVELSGAFNAVSDWGVHACIAHDGLQWGDTMRRIDKIDGILTLSPGKILPQVDGTMHCGEARWNEFVATEAEVTIAGLISAPRLTLRTSALPSGTLGATVDLPLDDLAAGRATVVFNDLDLAPVNDLLPPESIQLHGKVSGALNASGLDAFPRLEGEVVPNGVTLAVPYLGTRYDVEGMIEVGPDGFLMDQWGLFDADSTEARFNGTVLHAAFKEWDLDFGIEILDEPIALMNIPITDDALFYGTVRGTGDINISGYGPVLQIDATLEMGAGTDFALPMDSQNDVDYAEFVRFKKAQTETKPTATPRGTFSNTRLNLGIDVNEGAQARIVFDRKVGDEIVGNAKGHLDLEVNDFEQLDMTGNLEITEGAYYFTLQNWFNKRFDIQPGSTVSWEGDPYDAQLDVATTYTTRTALDPLLPDVDDLPGRIPVDLQLQLTGSMLRPGLDFDVEVPTADSRIQALVEGALVSEEEVQRQALGLLTLSQFIPTDPTTAAVGGFIQPAQSTQFLANQLGHWISQIAPAMDVGLDYAQDALSGEQAVGLALSTQLLNDRLHIEGEVGAQTFGTVQAEDFQIQDLTVSFDLTDDGGIQLTGHSRQNASLTNAIEGDAVQGVGIRFKWAFDEWGEWRNK